MLDVHGERLSLVAWIKSLDHVRQAELQRLVESVQIETIGRASGDGIPERDRSATDDGSGTSV